MQHTSLRVVVSSIFPDDKAEDHEHSVVVFAVAVGKRRQTEFHHHVLFWLSVCDRRLTNGIPLLSSSLFFPRSPGPGYKDVMKLGFCVVLAFAGGVSSVSRPLIGPDRSRDQCAGL